MLTAQQTDTLLNRLARLHANLGAVALARDAFKAQQRLALPAALSARQASLKTGPPLRRITAPASPPDNATP